MWDRLRRRTLAPSRPMLRPRRPALAALNVLAFVAGASYALYVVLS